MRKHLFSQDQVGKETLNLIKVNINLKINHFTIYEISLLNLKFPVLFTTTRQLAATGLKAEAAFSIKTLTRKLQGTEHEKFTLAIH